MRPSTNMASPVTISVGREVSPSGPITNKQGNLELQAGKTPEAIAILVQMAHFQSVYEAFKVAEARPATGQLSRTGSELVIDRSLIYNPSRVAHSQIGINIGSATVNTRA